MTSPLPVNTVPFPSTNRAASLSVTRSVCRKMLVLQSVDECGKPLEGTIHLPLDCDVIRDSCEELLSHIVDENQLSQFSKNNSQVVQSNIPRRHDRF
jgi:hypothetical protein